MVGFAVVRDAITWLADWPAANSASPRGPSCGSVRCWVKTAPTPARAKGQRLPTPILEVVTAAPSIPVRRHMPTRENVMRFDSVAFHSVLHHRLDVNFNEETRTGETIHDQPRPHRKYTFQYMSNDLIDGLTVGTIYDINRDFANIVEAGARFLQQGFDIRHGLGGLGRGVARADKFAVQRAASLATEVNAIAGPHGHRKLAAQVLAVFVLLARLEFT